MPAKNDRDDRLLKAQVVCEELEREGIEAFLVGIRQGSFTIRLHTSRVPKTVVEKLATKWDDVKNVCMHAAGGGAWQVVVTFDNEEENFEP